MDRRKFLEKSCLAGIAVIAGNVIDLANVKSLHAATRGEGEIREIPIHFEEAPELDNMGGVYRLVIDDMDKDILVVRTGRESFTAVDVRCTHKACDVAYVKEERVFQCPCHESKFDLQGVPQGGPATVPLQKYEVSWVEPEYIVKVPVPQP